MKLRTIISSFWLLLTSTFLSIGQESYNDCNSALELCPNQVYNVNNIDANSTFCPTCEDDFNDCFAPNNTVWFQFTTNDLGGDVSVFVGNVVFENEIGQGNELQANLFSATIPCNGTGYTPIGNCVFDATGSFSIDAFGLLANTIYYVVVSGATNGSATLPAEATFEIEVSGDGIDRVVPTIILEQSIVDVDLCPDEMVFFTVDTTNCPDSGPYEWFVNNQLVATTVTPEYTTAQLGSGDQVTVKTTCYTLCAEEVSDDSPVFNQISFPIDAGEDQTILLGNPIQLVGSTTAADFSWSPSFSLSDPSVLDPIAFPEVTTTYEFQATQNGCTLRDYVTINVEEELIIPNTFSPNDDGKNDTWVILGMEKYPNADVRIFNRWGQEVFQATGYPKDKAWDGTSRAGKLNSGVYFYIINLRDEDKTEFKGNISLIR